MPTMSDTIADVRRMVYGSMSEKLNLIGVTAPSVTTEVTMDMDVSGIQEGMILSSGLNVWYVKGVSVSDKKVFVIPNIDNSPSNAVTVGDKVFVRPRMTDWYAFNVLNDEIRAMSAPTNGLFKVGSWTVESDATYQTYEVPVSAAAMEDLIRVRYKAPGSPNLWVDLPTSAWRWRPTDSANRVQLTRNVPSGVDVTFVYKAPFTVATALTDDLVTTCGLADSMTDIPALGAAAVLLGTTESRRNQVQTQGDARRAEEVPASANNSAERNMRRAYEQRVNDEYARLRGKYPIFRGV